MEERSSKGQKTLWEKEKLLVTSNFSFSHIVFKRLVLQTRKNQGLFGKGLILGKTQVAVSTKLKNIKNFYKLSYCSHKTIYPISFRFCLLATDMLSFYEREGLPPLYRRHGEDFMQEVNITESKRLWLRYR